MKKTIIDTVKLSCLLVVALLSVSTLRMYMPPLYMLIVYLDGLFIMTVVTSFVLFCVFESVDDDTASMNAKFDLGATYGVFLWLISLLAEQKFGYYKFIFTHESLAWIGFVTIVFILFCDFVWKQLKEI